MGIDLMLWSMFTIGDWCSSWFVIFPSVILMFLKVYCVPGKRCLKSTLEESIIWIVWNDFARVVKMIMRFHLLFGSSPAKSNDLSGSMMNLYWSKSNLMWFTSVYVPWMLFIKAPSNSGSVCSYLKLPVDRYTIRDVWYPFFFPIPIPELEYRPIRSIYRYSI